MASTSTSTQASSRRPCRRTPMHDSEFAVHCDQCGHTTRQRFLVNYAQHSAPEILPPCERCGHDICDRCKASERLRCWVCWACDELVVYDPTPSEGSADGEEDDAPRIPEECVHCGYERDAACDEWVWWDPSEEGEKRMPFS